MKKALIGNNGHAREVMCQMGMELIRFVSDDFYSKEPNVFPLSQFSPEEYQLLIAMGSSEVRHKILQQLPENTKYFTFIHPSSMILSKDVIIEEGTFIGANCILTCNIRLGKHSLLNRGNQIGHDCIIGDFFSMMPNAVVSGNCEIGSGVYIGTNSSVREKIKICQNVKIGLNSGVLKNINEPGTYVGTPAKKIDNLLSMALSQS